MIKVKNLEVNILNCTNTLPVCCDKNLSAFLNIYLELSKRLCDITYMVPIKIMNLSWCEK